MSSRRQESFTSNHQGGDSGPPTKQFILDSRGNSLKRSGVGCGGTGPPQFMDKQIPVVNPVCTSSRFIPAPSRQDTRQQNTSHGSSPVTTMTSPAATPVGTGGTSTGTSTSGPKQRSVKRLKRMECELRIRKLRLEMEHAKIEHEEKMKVMRAQQEVLNSFKPNPASIMNLLFKS